MESSFKFIQKLWNIHNLIMNKIKMNQSSLNDERISKFTNNLIAKITKNLKTLDTM